MVKNVGIEAIRFSRGWVRAHRAENKTAAASGHGLISSLFPMLTY